jgi:ribonuclease HII
VLIDGRDNYYFDELGTQPEYIVWGDGKILEIWAASIIAKVFRDKLLLQYASLYPDLWIENHKWYGTKKHQESLKTIADITGIHRISYKPVAKILN